MSKIQEIRENGKLKLEMSKIQEIRENSKLKPEMSKIQEIRENSKLKPEMSKIQEIRENSKLKPEMSKIQEIIGNSTYGLPDNLLNFVNFTSYNEQIKFKSLIPLNNISNILTLSNLQSTSQRFNMISKKTESKTADLISLGLNSELLRTLEHLITYKIL